MILVQLSAVNSLFIPGAMFAGHVAIYDGNGMIVEAKNETAGITHDRSADCRPILAIRRFTTD